MEVESKVFFYIFGGLYVLSGSDAASIATKRSMHLFYVHKLQTSIHMAFYSLSGYMY